MEESTRLAVITWVLAALVFVALLIQNPYLYHRIRAWIETEAHRSRAWVKSEYGFDQIMLTAILIAVVVIAVSIVRRRTV